MLIRYFLAAALFASSPCYAQRNDFLPRVRIIPNPNPNESYSQVIVPDTSFAPYQALSILAGLEAGTITIQRYEKECPDKTELTYESPDRNSLEVQFNRREGQVCYQISGTAPLRGPKVSAVSTRVKRQFSGVHYLKRTETALEVALQQAFISLEESSYQAFPQ